MEATFCFVDLEGFSALTEAHGDEAAADLVERFAALVEAALQQRGRLVKTIGDAAFVTLVGPEEAVGFIQRVCTAARGEAGLPVLRAGLHHGEAIERGGDVFGSAVNVAARVTAYARGGQVVATDRVAQAARALGVEVTDLGPVLLRNIPEPVRLFALALGESPVEEAIDPVCRMRVSRARAAGRLRWKDADYWFCSLDCAARFVERPEAYLPS
jgi:class 3 adenylate cyclase